METNQRLLEAIFLSDNRNFGEQCGEAVYRAFSGFNKSKMRGCPDFDSGCEVKSVRALAKKARKNQNYLDRAVLYSDYQNQRFTVNFQHIKTAQLDHLIPIIFFGDCVVLLKIHREQLPTLRGYSATQTGLCTPNQDAQLSIPTARLHEYLQKFQLGIVPYDTASPTFKYIDF